MRQEPYVDLCDLGNAFALGITVRREEVFPSATRRSVLFQGKLTLTESKAGFDEQVATKIARPYEEKLSKRVKTAVRELAKIGYVWKTEPTVEDGDLKAGTGLEINGQEPAPLTILTPGDEYDPIVRISSSQKD